MNALTVEILAKILALNTEMYGMVAENQRRILDGCSLAYDELAFNKIAANLRDEAVCLETARKNGAVQ
jgi:hypothetical protein